MLVKVSTGHLYLANHNIHLLFSDIRKNETTNYINVHLFYIISYHITSYHIIYHIISYQIISHISFHIISIGFTLVCHLFGRYWDFFRAYLLVKSFVHWVTVDKIYDYLLFNLIAVTWKGKVCIRIMAPAIVSRWRALSLQWRHNGRGGVSNHQPHDWLLNRLFSTDQIKHQSSALLAFVRGIHRWPAQMASNAENVSIRWLIMFTAVWKLHKSLQKTKPIIFR